MTDFCIPNHLYDIFIFSLFFSFFTIFTFSCCSSSSETISTSTDSLPIPEIIALWFSLLCLVKRHFLPNLLPQSLQINSAVLCYCFDWNLHSLNLHDLIEHAFLVCLLLTVENFLFGLDGLLEISVIVRILMCLLRKGLWTYITGESIDFYVGLDMPW